MIHEKPPAPIDLSSEIYRTYHYGDGTSYTIPSPKQLYLLAGGASHRVVDINDVTHAPRRPWVAITWKQSNGKAFDF